MLSCLDRRRQVETGVHLWRSAISPELLTQPGHKASAVYGWMKAHSLAAHAVPRRQLRREGARGLDHVDDWHTQPEDTARVSPTN
jgi:hypothetical protein